MHFRVREDSEEIRVDLFLARCFETLSRSRIQILAKEGRITVNGRPCKANTRLKRGDEISVAIPPAKPLDLQPEPVVFSLLYEDDALLVVDKPAGLVVHPAAGHWSGTLVHGLLHHCGTLSGIGGVERPGIVHRLDKDTSGLVVVAKSDTAHASLATQFQSGDVSKIYRAVVHGRMREARGEIVEPIGRHPVDRKRMAVVPDGRHARTLWDKEEDLPGGLSLLRVTLMTGRTHQIRVHLAYVGHPVAGDSVYGHGPAWWARQREGLFREVPCPSRQMLHAWRLGFLHPVSRRPMAFEAPLPEDMALLIEDLRGHTGTGP